MTEAMDAINSENDDLTCPITLEPFHDPVIAKDGRVYEREAITKWILEHGTSPFTREPLKIHDLQSDNRLRRLAAQQRNATVSYNAREDSITLPPRRKLPSNQRQMVMAGGSRVNRPIHSSKCPCRIIGFIMCSCFICISVAFGIIVGVGILKLNSSASPQLEITSNYSSSLTRNSPRFIRRFGNGNQYFYYNAIQVVVPIGGSYKFQSFSNINMYGCLYTQYFTATDPFANIMTCDDDTGGDQQFYFRIPLESSNYTLVPTTFQGNTTGSFSISVTGPTNVIFQ